MNYILEFTDEAKSDLKDATNWYKIKNNNLAVDFIVKIENCINYFKENPFISPIIYKNVRKIKIERFPYSILYIIKDEKIVIFSIMHSSRNPEIWQKRV